MLAYEPQLKRVYWETTAACNLHCIHCRRVDVLNRRDPDELSTEEAASFIRQLEPLGRPVLIFSGGEPLERPDILRLAALARTYGLPVALSTNGTLVNEHVAKEIKEAGIYYASISLDGATPETHNHFRGNRNYERAWEGMEHLQKAGLKVQINFTVTRRNVQELPAMCELAGQRQAVALYLFLLVPVGCGVQIAPSDMLSAQEVETWLEWVCDQNRRRLPFELRVICAPHYYRVLRQRPGQNSPQVQGGPLAEAHETRLGCLAGINICFVSHRGDVFPCGYLPQSAGNLRRQSFRKIWEGSALFRQLRDPDLLAGRCGDCEFKGVCGGCRARAFYANGSVLAEEPYCSYNPLPC